MILGCIISFIFGGMFGVLLTALLVVNRNGDDSNYEVQQRREEVINRDDL